MSSLRTALREFWFARAPATSLAVTRFVLCTYLLTSSLPTDVWRLMRVSAQPMEFMEPSAVLSVLPLPFPMSSATIEWFGAAMALLAVSSAVGLLTRPSLILFALGYAYIGASISAWGYVTHSRILPLQVLVILAVAPGTTAWSLDRLLAWARRRRKLPSLPFRRTLAGPLVPRWGSQLMVVVFAVLLFSAGLSKLRYSGLEWADGQTLGFYLSGGTVTNVLANAPDELQRPNRWTDGFAQFVARPGLHDSAWKDGVGIDAYLYMTGGTPLGRAVAKVPWLLAALSGLTLLIELAAPLLLFDHRVRSLYLLAVSGFFIGILLTMGINFLSWVVLSLCWVNWRWVASPVLHRAGAALRTREPAARGPAVAR